MAEALAALSHPLTGGHFGLVKSAQTDRAPWPLTTYPRAERVGICQESYSPGRFEIMKNFTRSKTLGQDGACGTNQSGKKGALSAALVGAQPHWA